MKLKKRSIEVSYYNKRKKCFMTKVLLHHTKATLTNRVIKSKTISSVNWMWGLFTIIAKPSLQKINCKSRLYNTIKLTCHIKLQRTTIMHNITQNYNTSKPRAGFQNQSIFSADVRQRKIVNWKIHCAVSDKSLCC